MSYGTTSAIGDCHLAVEHRAVVWAGRTPVGIGAGMDGNPIAFIFIGQFGMSVKEWISLYPALEGSHFAVRSRVSPLGEQIVGNTDVDSSAGFRIGLRLSSVRVYITSSRVSGYDPAVGSLTIARRIGKINARGHSVGEGHRHRSLGARGLKRRCIKILRPDLRWLAPRIMRHNSERGAAGHIAIECPRPSLIGDQIFDQAAQARPRRRDRLNGA